MKIEVLTVGAFDVNCWVVSDSDDHALVVDPGAEPDRILDFVEKQNLTVSAWLLTHGHIDHIGAINDVVAALPAPIVLHADDAAWAFGPENRFAPYYPPVAQPESKILSMRDGDSSDFDGPPFTVIATPGHTPGSVCFYFEQDRVLISGDTLFKGSVGRTDLPGGDARVLSASLRKIAGLPDEIRVCPGHGPASDMRTERRTNYFVQAALLAEERESRV